MQCIVQYCVEAELCCMRYNTCQQCLNPFTHFIYVNIQIESQNPATKDQQPQLFPENVHGLQESVITCVALASDFLAFATDVSSNRM